MLVDIGRAAETVLVRRAVEIRARPAEAFDGRPIDHVTAAILCDKVNAEVCRLIATRGSSAMVRSESASNYREKGFSDNEIALIDRGARRHAEREASDDWDLGPPRRWLSETLKNAGVFPSEANIRALRRSALFVFADLLEAVEPRYFQPPASLGEILRAIRGGELTEPAPVVEPVVAMAQDTSAHLRAAQQTSKTDGPSFAWTRV